MRDIGKGIGKKMVAEVGLEGRAGQGFTVQT